LLALVSGCEREAPGPIECRQFALSAVGVTRREQLAAPHVNQKVEELTRECLTEPYDRELLRCYRLGAPARACQYEFKVRRKQAR
jgi:hypothetical protein